MLRVVDLVGRHAAEEIIARIEVADMIEAEPAIAAGLIGRPRFGAGRAEFAGRAAPRRVAHAHISLETNMKTRVGPVFAWTSQPWSPLRSEEQPTELQSLIVR